MTAENQEHDEPEIIDEVVEEVEAEEGGAPEAEEAEAAIEDEEFEIVLEGEDPAPQKGKMPKRVKKLLEKQNVLQSDLENQATVAQQNAAEIERLKQELAASRQPAQPIAGQMPLPPTEESVDYDPERLVAAQQKYQADLTNWFASQQLQGQQKTAQEQAQAQRATQEREALNKHYERADSLKTPDYEANEEAAVSSMGADLVKTIAMNLPNSAMVINYLGKNPAKAKRIAELDQTDPRTGLAELFELNFKLKAVPRKKSKAPEPEAVVESGNGSASPLQKQYDKATENGDIKGRRELRKKAKAQGITLQD